MRAAGSPVPVGVTDRVRAGIRARLRSLLTTSIVLSESCAAGSSGLRLNDGSLAGALSSIRDADGTPYELTADGSRDGHTTYAQVISGAILTHSYEVGIH